MKTVLFRLRRLLKPWVFGVPLVMAGAMVVAADFPPGGYTVVKDSLSPDKHYGLVVPNHASLEDEEVAKVNYLADVKGHRLLGKIRGADYTDNENHRGLEIFWAADSSRVLINYEGRYGLDQLMVLEPHAKDFGQVEIDKFVHNSLNAMATKQAHGDKPYVDASLSCRWMPDGKLRLRALGQTNPKSFADVPTYYALFQGTYDFKTQKWTAVDERPIKEHYEELGDVLQPSDFSGHTYASEDERATALDKMLNDEYTGLRVLLPAERFAQVKKEQIAWLKTRDAAGSTKAKGDLLEARIKALEELTW